MTPSLDGLPTEAKEAYFPHEVRLAPLDINPVFRVSGNVLVTCYLTYNIPQSYLILHCTINSMLPLVTLVFFVGYCWSIFRLAVPISRLAVVLVKVFAILSLTRFNLFVFSG